MYTPLIDAPFCRPLMIRKMIDRELAMRLGRIGLFEGSEILRLDEEVLVRPVRVRGPEGDAVLGGGMAMKIVVHRLDGQKLPLIEMQPNESGHIEGLTGGTALEKTLETLRLKRNDPILFLRRLPPMEYVAVAAGGGRVRLTEGMAVKIWGRMSGPPMQFVSAPTGAPFHVDQILGGPTAWEMIRNQGIEAGTDLILEEVVPAQSISPGVRTPVVVFSPEGLRLFLPPGDAAHILVAPINSEA